MENRFPNAVKADHMEKVTGKVLYVGDYQTAADGRAILTGGVLRSAYAKAKILSVKLPEMPSGYSFVSARDVPGQNRVENVVLDMPIFAEENVEYIGEPIGMVVGENPALVQELLSKISVEYEVFPPVLDAETSEVNFADHDHSHGDLAKAFAEADHIFEESFRTGYQEQAYLETQGIMVEPGADGKIYAHGSMQCGFYVHDAIVRALGCPTEDVHVLQDATGGGFGGKEDVPSMLASMTAVAAKKVNAPVRLQYTRKEDAEFTSKRHPSLCRYKAAVKDGKVTAMDVDIILNAGAYVTLSDIVLARSISSCSGVYNIPNMHIRGRAVKTNTVPCGAFRGFGGPQVFFAVEVFMGHIAERLSMDILEFKRSNTAKMGDPTCTDGRYHFPVPVLGMIDQLDQVCSYREKAKAYALPQEGRYRRGIGLSLFFQGSGFTGTGEKDFVKAKVKLHKYADDRVEILASNTDMGQGTRTTFPKIAARALGIPLEQVFYRFPDTGRVPNSGPTVASRSILIVGELIRRAALKLKEQWVSGEEIEVEEQYRHPDFLIPYDANTFHGDAYGTYTWGVNVVETEIDTLTGQPKILGAYGCFDVGTPIDEAIIIGQMEGGMTQGIGYATMERMSYDKRGFIRNTSLSDYLVPTSNDVPNLKCVLYPSEYSYGPYGAKSAGEVPLVGAAPAFALAVEQAVGVRVDHAPFTQEDILLGLSRKEEEKA